jgi:hypothetical protein
MDKFKIIIGLYVTVFLATIFILNITVGNEIKDEINKIENSVGQKIVLQKDTLLIIDYSILNSNYTLEDGRQINFSLANKLEWADKNK